MNLKIHGLHNETLAQIKHVLELGVYEIRLCIVHSKEFITGNQSTKLI